MEITMAPKTHTVRTTRRRIRALGGGPPFDVDVDAGTLDEHLPALAQLIEERTFAGDDDPQIIRITRAGLTAEGIDVGLRLIDDIDDIDESVVSALTGFNAPIDWLAIGVATGGSAYPIDEGRDARRRVRLVHLVTRRGTAASVVRLAGGEPCVLVDDADDGTAIGRVDDVCRRALGLPTAPAGSTLEFWALTWLDSIVGSGTAGAPSTWDEVAARHLAIRVFAEAEPDLVPDASASLVRLGVLSANVHSWSELRAECGAGRYDVAGMPSAVARWLDDGAFGRWMMGNLPSCDALTTAACELLRPDLARRLRAVLREWGLDPPS
jgi:hypothetical protein